MKSIFRNFLAVRLHIILGQMFVYISCTNSCLFTFFQPHRGPQQRPGPMGPPTGPAGPFPTNHTSRDPAAAANAAAAAAAAAHAAAHVAAANPSRLQKIGNALPILNLPDHKTNEPDMQKIFSDMIVESSIMPPPLSAIITPRYVKCHISCLFTFLL